MTLPHRHGPRRDRGSLVVHSWLGTLFTYRGPHTSWPGAVFAPPRPNATLPRRCTNQVRFMSSRPGHVLAGEATEAAYDHAHCLDPLSHHPHARAAPLPFWARRSCEAVPAVSKTFTNRSARQPWAKPSQQEFRCRHCRQYVGALPWGGQHRNHCPFCLYSRHVDARTPGDRASDCGGSMQSIGHFTRRNGESMIVHRCHECGQERANRIAADDDFALVQSLPVWVARRGRRVHPDPVAAMKMRA